LLRVFLAVALVPACDSAAPWADPASGLTWQAEVTSGYVDHEAAVAFCDGLVLEGADDWRLPTISELRTLVVGCEGSEDGVACPVTDECSWIACQTEDCYACEHGPGPADGCYGNPELSDSCEYLWSSTLVADEFDRAWAVGFPSAFVYKPRVWYAFHARCVR
jgi:hypothetical protein